MSVVLLSQVRSLSTLMPILIYFLAVDMAIITTQCCMVLYPTLVMELKVSLNLGTIRIGDPSLVYVDMVIGMFQLEGITVCKALACRHHCWDGHPAWSYEKFMDYMMDIVKRDHRQYQLFLDLAMN
ncbi:hypothetical protein F5146DRAFT_1006552 [Armillaria mellea]|nr:hypothetical protein F5146DRAFT_1006552 [Armillaria mellea]